MSLISWKPKILQFSLICAVGQRRLTKFIGVTPGRETVFFCLSSENHQITRKVERKTVSDFYWLKTPPAPSVTPAARYLHGFSFERFPRLWLLLLSLFNEVGSSSRVTPSLMHLYSHVWWADPFRKRTSRGLKPLLVWNLTLDLSGVSAFTA